MTILKTKNWFKVAICNESYTSTVFQQIIQYFSRSICTHGLKVKASHSESGNMGPLCA